MSFALSTGVTGLQAHQKMLDVAGNNLANINTTAFKASRITFSELLSETLSNASQPTSYSGGTNPQQMGTGVGVAGITPNMTQGNIVSTGNPLDMAIDGGGYFVLSSSGGKVYTRAGSFGVDAAGNLVDPETGYLVQRIGATGVADGFQTAGSSNIYVPFGVTMEAKATTEIDLQGNLSKDGTLSSGVQTQKLTSNIAFTTSSGTAATSTTLLSALDQYTGTLTSGTLTFSGYKPDGTALSAATYTVDLTMPITATTTLGDVETWLDTDEGTAAVDEVQTITTTGVPTGGTFTLTYGGQTTTALTFDESAADIEAALNALSSIGANGVSCTGGALPTGVVVTFDGTALDETDISPLVFNNSLTGGTSPAGVVTETTKGRAVQGVLGTEADASIVDGKLVITDVASGYSRSDLTMAWSGDGTLTMPGYFELTTVGGEEVKNIDITTYDSFGTEHVLSGALVRTDTANTWDAVLTSASGNIGSITMDDRRIRSIEFDSTNGTYSGLNAGVGDTAQFVITYTGLSAQTIALDFGVTGTASGLAQMAGSSTAVARDQDGYSAGTLNSVSVDKTGILVGLFTNGEKKDIAAIQVALFQNPTALESVGNGHYVSSGNSGEAVATQGMSGGAGAVRGGSLEKSNADVATEFVNMIQAQNGFQANARTIKVANEILRELTNLIR